MALQPGATLGPYEILSLLGRGGMGEVWRARDHTLHRDVAVKVVSARAMADTDRLTRFAREGQLLASLNHPHIASIYGIQESGGIAALVLELVEGPTLADIIARGPMPVTEALRLGAQIASALEAAHERGIIHRDLKPANVKLTADGDVKVLDFGLAKAIEARAPFGGSLVETSPVVGTQAGVILGTAAYMSPEQAKGDSVDRRCDVWAFGCVLYELLTATRPFPGQSVAEVVAGILSKDVDLTRLPSPTPASVVALLRRCFEREPRYRLRDIGEARVLLERPAAVWSVASPQPVARPRLTLGVAVGGLVLGAALGIAIFSMWSTARRPAPPRQRMAFTLPLTPASRLPQSSAFQRPNDRAVAIASDGRFVVFAGERLADERTESMLYRRAVGQPVATAIPGTEGAQFGALSPDGEWIAFVAGGSLRKVPIAGGTPSLVCALDLAVFGGKVTGASWGDDDTIVLGSHAGPLRRVAATGGTPVEITRFTDDTSDYSHRLPHQLPKARGVLFTTIAVPIGDLGRTYVLPRGGAAPRLLLANAADARYLRSGQILFARDGALFAAPFDVDRLEVTGAAELVEQNVMQALHSDNPWWNSAAGQFDGSDTGTLVFASGGVYPPVVNRLLWLYRDGRTEPIGEPGQSLLGPRISPDGTRIVVGQMRDMMQPLRVYDIGRHLWTSWIGVTGQAAFPVWTPDGEQVVFGSVRDGRSGVYMGRRDDSVALRQLTAGPRPRVPSDVSPDGRVLAFVEAFTPTKSDIWVVPLDGSRAPVVVVRNPGDDLQPVFAPDGRWLAYASDVTGTMEVFVQAFPGPGSRVQVSSGGGIGAIWARDGRTLYYVRRTGTDSTLMEVPFQTTPALRPGTPRAITAFPYLVSGPARSHDVTADGQRFLVSTYDPPQATPVTELQVIVNWR